MTILGCAPEWRPLCVGDGPPSGCGSCGVVRGRIGWRQLRLVGNRGWPVDRNRLCSALELLERMVAMPGEPLLVSPAHSVVGPGVRPQRIAHRASAPIDPAGERRRRNHAGRGDAQHSSPASHPPTTLNAPLSCWRWWTPVSLVRLGVDGVVELGSLRQTFSPDSRPPRGRSVTSRWATRSGRARQLGRVTQRAAGVLGSVGGAERIVVDMAAFRRSLMRTQPD